jgi:hypothetical protein
MSASFNLVQSNEAIGYSVFGTATISFTSPVAYGNSIVVAFGKNTSSAGPAGAYPSSVTDNLGNTYVLYSQSAGYATNRGSCAFLYVAQAVTGGSCTITVSGWAGGVWDGPSLICAEFEMAESYEVWGSGISLAFLDLESQQNNSYSAADSSAKFRALANNGSPGGSGCSDTGTCLLTILPSSPPSVGSNIVAVAFVNQFLDVFLIAANYSVGHQTPPTFTSTGTIVNTTLEGGRYPDELCSLGLAFQDFPYLGGPPQADCDNPPNGTIGVAYGPGGLGHGIVASGGTAPYTYALVGGILPPGLTLNTSTGVISGTPTFAGKFLFTVQVTDSLGGTAVANCSIAICPVSGTPTVSNSGWTG